MSHILATGPEGFGRALLPAALFIGAVASSVTGAAAGGLTARFGFETDLWETAGASASGGLVAYFLWRFLMRKHYRDRYLP